jgi:hypothetical protein
MKTMVLNLITLFILLTGCHKKNTGSESTEIPAVYKKVYGASDMYIDGNYIVISSNGLPDHKSPYYKGTQWESSLYEAYNGSNTSFMQNPNKIASASLTFRLPLYPVKAASVQATPMGPIGISLNGVPFYNQYAANYQPLTMEINTLDQYNGHPQQMGGYHYHIEPTWLTAKYGKHVLLGFLLDGFPVYGPLENNTTITNDALDACHGHTHATTDYPDGIYHYHITADAPYLNGTGFYGTPGTVAQ